MAAHIRSAIPLKPTLQDQSRDDLRDGDVVTLTSVDLHTTYTWTITFAPEALDGTPSASILSTPTLQSCQFTVDNEGAYLIRLVVDAGLPTESIEFVRLRYLTKFADLKLVGAGERRDQTAVIPVDASPEGWANNQNFNIQQLQAILARVSTSGRTLFVDANRGRDNTNPQNDPTIAEAYADYSSITSAIIDAVNTVPAPSRDNPFVIKVQPGYYEEDLALAAHVHVVGLSSAGQDSADRTVLVRTVIKHEADLVNVGDLCIVSGLHFETVFSTTDPILYKTGLGTLVLDECTLTQTGSSASQGACVFHDKGTFMARDTLFNSEISDPGRVAFYQEADAVLASDSYFERCTFIGPCGVNLNPSDLPNGTARFVNCFIESTLTHISSFGLRTGIDDFSLERCEIKVNGITNALDIGAFTGIHGSQMFVTLLWTRILGNVSFDTTGVTSTRLDWGSVEYNAAIITGALTSGPNALVKSSTLYYDNSLSGLVAENVQDALDEVAPGILTTLDTAYDGPAGSGSGRTIIAEDGSVVIQASAAPPAIPDPGQIDGWLQVEGNIQAGGVGSPEVNIQPNPDMAGPSIVLGQNVYPDIASTPHRGLPSGTLRARSTGSPLFHNYNLRLETESTWGASNGEVGRIIIKAGEAASYTGVIPSPPDAGFIHIQGGEAAFSAAQLPGSIYLAPGYNALTPQVGYVTLANPATNTLSSLTAAGVFVGGVAGDITFYIGGVGPQTASIGVADNNATVCGKLNDLIGITCPAASPIVLYTDATGPNAEILYAFDDQTGALNTALGDFTLTGGAVFVSGVYVETVDVGCSAADTFTIYGDLTVTGTYPGGGALHAATHLFGAVDEVDGDRLDIDYVPTNYVRDITPPEVTNVQELTAHLAGIDNALVGGGPVPLHASTHVRGATDVIDGDILEITFTPVNYTPNTTPPQVTNTDELTAHLAGIEEGLHTVYRQTTSAVLYVPSINDHYIGVDTTPNPVLIDLPSAAPNIWSGRVIIIKDEGGLSAINSILIQVGGGVGLIDGAPLLPLTSNFASATLVCNGVPGPGCSWYIV